MIIILTFVFNAGLNFLLGLAVAAVLGPAEYGRFAIGVMVAIVLGTACFDWLRLSATRFYTEESRGTDPGLRASLNGGYVAVTGLVVVAAGLILALRLDTGLSAAALAASVGFALASARFDFTTALIRARFLERAHAVLMGLKNALAFAAAIGAALAFKDAAWTLAALAGAAVVSTLPARGVLKDADATWRLVARDRLAGFARYGVPVVAANVIYQVIVLANRSFAAASFGFAEAGQLSLATDMGIRLLLAIGAALDVYLFQLAVRRDAREGREAALAQVRLNMTVMAAAAVLLAVGYACAMPAFEALVVPARYRDAFGPVSLVLLPGVAVFCFANFGLNPVFQLLGRTGPAAWAAGVALAADLGGLALLPRWAGILGYAAVHSASLGLGGVAAAVLAFRAAPCRPANRDLLAIAGAGALAAAVIWPTRALPEPAAALGAAALAGTTAYLAVLVWFDVAGARAFAQRWLPRRALPLAADRA